VNNEEKMTFDEWMSGVAPAYKPSDDSVQLRILRQCWIEAQAAERDRCASICDGIGAGYAGAARRLGGQHATHAAGQRDGANECAAAIRMTPNAALSGPNRRNRPAPEATTDPAG